MGRVNHAQPEIPRMNSRPPTENRTPSDKLSIIPTMLTPKEAAQRLRLRFLSIAERPTVSMRLDVKNWPRWGAPWPGTAKPACRTRTSI